MITRTEMKQKYNCIARIKSTKDGKIRSIISDVSELEKGKASVKSAIDEARQQNLKQVVILGIDSDDNNFFIRSDMDFERFNYFLYLFTHKVMNG